MTEYFPGGHWRDYEARDAPTISDMLSRLDDARCPPPPGFRRNGPVAVIGYRCAVAGAGEPPCRSSVLWL